MGVDHMCENARVWVAHVCERGRIKPDFKGSWPVVGVWLGSVGKSESLGHTPSGEHRSDLRFQLIATVMFQPQGW